MSGTKRKASEKARRRERRTSPKSSDDMRALAREAAMSAIARLAELSNSGDERVALAATQELLNRAFGKIPAAGGDDASAASQQLVVKIVRFGAEDAPVDRKGAADREPGVSA